MIPANLKYTEEHEWVQIDGDIATIGITTHAAEELGEIVFVELPKPETEYAQMAEFGSIESVKTVSSLFLPVSGIVTEINDELTDTPETVNESPYDDGWLVKIKISDPSEADDLMSNEEYAQYLESL